MKKNMPTNATMLQISPARAFSRNTIYINSDYPHTAVCPICGENYVHIEKPIFEDGEDNYQSSAPHLRGDLIAIPCWGECGHRWQLCFAFHKGNTMTFIRKLPEVPDVEE